MTEEAEKLITAGMLSDVLGRAIKEESQRINISDDNITFAYADEDMWSDISIYELKDKLEEWFAPKAIIVFTTGYDVERGAWAAAIDVSFCRGKTKLEALLKLYHKGVE